MDNKRGYTLAIAREDKNPFDLYFIIQILIWKSNLLDNFTSYIQFKYNLIDKISFFILKIDGSKYSNLLYFFNQYVKIIYSYLPILMVIPT